MHLTATITLYPVVQVQLQGKSILGLILCASKCDDIINKSCPSLSCGHVRYLLHRLESGLQNLGKDLDIIQLGCFLDQF